MRTSMSIFAGLLFLAATTASGQNYQQAMGSALGEFAQAKTVEDFRNAGNKFVMIANAEPFEWLPLYHHAHCYIMMSFLKEPIPKKGMGIWMKPPFRLTKWWSWLRINRRCL